MPEGAAFFVVGQATALEVSRQMIQLCLMRDTDVSRTAILEAAFDLLNRNPSATLAEIATHAGVGRATLHRHFDGRRDLMLALARNATEELDAAVEAATAGAQTHTEGLRLALEAMIPLATRQWFLATDPIARDPEVAGALAEEKRLLKAEIDAARAEGAFAPQFTTEWIAETYEALLFAAWALVRDGEATPKQAALMAWTTFSNGLRA